MNVEVKLKKERNKTQLHHFTKCTSSLVNPGKGGVTPCPVQKFKLIVNLSLDIFNIKD